MLPLLLLGLVGGGCGCFTGFAPPAPVIVPPQRRANQYQPRYIYERLHHDGYLGHSHHHDFDFHPQALRDQWELDNRRRIPQPDRHVPPGRRLDFNPGRSREFGDHQRTQALTLPFVDWQPPPGWTRPTTPPPLGFPDEEAGESLYDEDDDGGTPDADAFYDPDLSETTQSPRESTTAIPEDAPLWGDDDDVTYDDTFGAFDEDDLPVDEDVIGDDYLKGLEEPPKLQIPEEFGGQPLTETVEAAAARAAEEAKKAAEAAKGLAPPDPFGKKRSRHTGRRLASTPRIVRRPKGSASRYAACVGDPLGSGPRQGLDVRGGAEGFRGYASLRKCCGLCFQVTACEGIALDLHRGLCFLKRKIGPAQSPRPGRPWLSATMRI